MELRKNIKPGFMTASVALLVVSLLLLTGCAISSDSEVETGASIDAVESGSAVSAAPVDHEVDDDPAPLSEGDEALSLAGYGAAGALADEDLTILDMLTYAVQDEYLARGEYEAIEETFGAQKPYTNIKSAEETHLAYLKEVYAAYGLEFPEDESASHIVIPENLLEAALTGVQAEIDNIEMYEIFMSHELPENVYEVFSALKSGSESHLLAFQKQVDRLD